MAKYERSTKIYIYIAASSLCNKNNFALLSNKLRFAFGTQEWIWRRNSYSRYQQFHCLVLLYIWKYHCSWRLADTQNQQKYIYIYICLLTRKKELWQSYISYNNNNNHYKLGNVRFYTKMIILTLKMTRQKLLEKYTQTIGEFSHII